MVPRRRLNDMRRFFHPPTGRLQPPPERPIIFTGAKKDLTRRSRRARILCCKTAIYGSPPCSSSKNLCIASLTIPSWPTSRHAGPGAGAPCGGRGPLGLVRCHGTDGGLTRRGAGLGQRCCRSAGRHTGSGSARCGPSMVPGRKRPFRRCTPKGSEDNPKGHALLSSSSHFGSSPLRCSDRRYRKPPDECPLWPLCSDLGRRLRKSDEHDRQRGSQCRLQAKVALEAVRGPRR